MQSRYISSEDKRLNKVLDRALDFTIWSSTDIYSSVYGGLTKHKCMSNKKFIYIHVIKVEDPSYSFFLKHHVHQDFDYYVNRGAHIPISDTHVVPQ